MTTPAISDQQLLDYRGQKLLGVYATAKEARRKHHIWPQRSKEYQRMMTQRGYNPGGKEGAGGG